MRRSPLMREWAWHRRVWRLAWPMVVSNLSVPLLGAVDTAVIGHLPEPHFLGAVAVGALIFNTLYFGCNFLRMGTTGLTAQAFGARDFDAARATLARAFLIALVLAAALLALQGPIGWLAFYLVEPSEAVAGEGMRYFFIRIWGAPAALANIAVVGWFIGMQNTRAALALLLTVNGINIVLDLVLVLGFDLAVAGVAWATVTADYAGLILGVAVTARLARRHGGHWRARLVLDAAAMRRFLGINRDIFLRTLFVITAFALFTTLSARQGDVVLAANAVVLSTSSSSLILRSMASPSPPRRSPAARSVPGGVGISPAPSGPASSGAFCSPSSPSPSTVRPARRSSACSPISRMCAPSPTTSFPG